MPHFGLSLPSESYHFSASLQSHRNGIIPGCCVIVPSPGMGLYVHVPFCKTKCPYCDFNTYQGIEGQMGGYLEAVTSELRSWGDALGRPGVQTVFFGGGTPSYLPEGDILAILEAACGHSIFSPYLKLPSRPTPVTWMQPPAVVCCGRE